MEGTQKYILVFPESTLEISRIDFFALTKKSVAPSRVWTHDFFVLSLIHTTHTGNVTLSDEKRLIKHLLERYKKFGVVGRPVQNKSETISVEYGLGLIQIQDLDEKNQVLTTNVWCRYVSFFCLGRYVCMCAVLIHALWCSYS